MGPVDSSIETAEKEGLAMTGGDRLPEVSELEKLIFSWNADPTDTNAVVFHILNLNRFA